MSPIAVVSHASPNLVHGLGRHLVDLVTDSYAAGLCTGTATSWTSTQWAYVYAADITGAYTEVTTGGGYTSGWGNRSGNFTTLTYSSGAATATNIWTVTAPAPITFGASTTITARSMFIYDKTANTASTDANSWYATIIDFGANVTSTAGAFTYTVDPVNGLAVWTES